MGGYGSGRSGGRPTADMSKRIDICWMVRTGRAVPGERRTGTLSWNCGGHPAGSISYDADMRDADNSELQLSYWRGDLPDRERVKQTVRLTYTQPNYGGRRWWMICPFRHIRVGKLYLPAVGDRFASRKAWRLAYQSQRLGHRDRPFEKLFRLQRKLGCEQGWDSFIHRPKGMWHRTFDRHMARHQELDDECSVEVAGMLALLNRLG
jgi:hypothetical protein